MGHAVPVRRTIRPVRFGGLQSARRMRHKHEGFRHLRPCSTGFGVKKRRSSAGCIARLRDWEPRLLSVTLFTHLPAELC
jgi:hypothetical protein